jgi:hypothetical protein
MPFVRQSPVNIEILLHFAEFLSGACCRTTKNAMCRAVLAQVTNAREGDFMQIYIRSAADKLSINDRRCGGSTQFC